MIYTMFDEKELKMKPNLEKPIEGEWEKEFDEFFVGTKTIKTPGRNLNLAIVKDFIRQTILTERAKWKREMMEIIPKEVDDYGRTIGEKAIPENQRVSYDSVHGYNKAIQEIKKKLEEA